MRLSMQAEPRTLTASGHGLGPLASAGTPGTGALPSAPSFIELLNTLASPQKAGSRREHLDAELNGDASNRIHPSPEPVSYRVAAARGGDTLGLAESRSQPMSSPQGRNSQSASLPNASSSGSPLPLQPSPIAPANSRSGAPSQLIPGAPWSQMLLLSLRSGPGVFTDPLSASSEAPQPVSRPGLPALPSWRAKADLRIASRQQAASQTAPGAADIREENFIDALSRGATTIRARLAADGAWHARFRSSDHGLISVRVAAGRDGVLAVNVRGTREALARLDEDQMSSVLRRPVRLTREPSDAPFI